MGNAKGKVSRTPRRANSGRGESDNELLVYKTHFSHSFVIKIINVSETPDCQRCISIMVQTKDTGKILCLGVIKIIRVIRIYRSFWVKVYSAFTFLNVKFA